MHNDEMGLYLSLKHPYLLKMIGYMTKTGRQVYFLSGDIEEGGLKIGPKDPKDGWISKFASILKQ